MFENTNCVFVFLCFCSLNFEEKKEELSEIIPDNKYFNYVLFYWIIGTNMGHLYCSSAPFIRKS